MSNRILVKPNGPIVIQGDLKLLDSEQQMLSDDNELYLCRCGQSANKPFCDGTHKQISFSDNADFTDNRPQELEPDAPLTLQFRENAMIIASGPVTITNTKGSSMTTRNKVALCRCGKSANKPFCDASHKQAIQDI